jgi:GNAT superfamily N-acetyltransferase
LTELRRPRPLDPSLHDRSSFDSGSSGLDAWLGRYSTQNRGRSTAATWVIADAVGVVVAYVSLAMTSIDRGAAPSLLATHAADSVPGLLIGRLAVERSRAGLGVGTALVAHVLATVVALNGRAACRAIVVSALDDAARLWWERLGFHRSDPADEGNLDLYLLTGEIEATMRSLG